MRLTLCMSPAKKKRLGDGHAGIALPCLRPTHEPSTCSRPLEEGQTSGRLVLVRLGGAAARALLPDAALVLDEVW